MEIAEASKSLSGVTTASAESSNLSDLRHALSELGELNRSAPLAAAFGSFQRVSSNPVPSSEQIESINETNARLCGKLTETLNHLDEENGQLKSRLFQLHSENDILRGHIVMQWASSAEQAEPVSVSLEATQTSATPSTPLSSKKAKIKSTLPSTHARKRVKTSASAASVKSLPADPRLSLNATTTAVPEPTPQQQRNAIGTSPSFATSSSISASAVGRMPNPLQIQSYGSLHPYGGHGMSMAGSAPSHPSYNSYLLGTQTSSYPTYSPMSLSSSSSVLTSPASMYGNLESAFSPNSGAVLPSHTAPSSPSHKGSFGSSASSMFGFGVGLGNHNHSQLHGIPVSHPFLAPSTFPPPPSPSPSASASPAPSPSPLPSTPAALKLPALANISADAPTPVYVIVSDISWSSLDKHWDIRGAILGSEEPRFMSDKNLLLSNDDKYLLVARWGLMFAQFATSYRCFKTAAECLDGAKELKLIGASVARLEDKSIWMVESQSYLSAFERTARFHSLDQADVKRIEPLMQKPSIAPFFHHDYLRSLCCSKPAPPALLQQS